jgi:hypothetical protein
MAIRFCQRLRRPMRTHNGIFCAARLENKGDLATLEV